MTGCSLVCGGAFGRFSSNVLGQGFGLVSLGVHNLAGDGGDERVWWLLVEFRGLFVAGKRRKQKEVPMFHPKTHGLILLGKGLKLFSLFGF